MLTRAAAVYSSQNDLEHEFADEEDETVMWNPTPDIS